MSFSSVSRSKPPCFLLWFLAPWFLAFSLVFGPPKSPLVLFPPLIFGPSSSVAEAFFWVLLESLFPVFCSISCFLVFLCYLSSPPSVCSVPSCLRLSPALVFGSPFSVQFLQFFFFVCVSAQSSPFKTKTNGGKSTRICCWLSDQKFPWPENNPFLPTIDCRCNGSDGSGGRPLQKMNSVSTDSAVLKFNDYLRFGP